MPIKFSSTVIFVGAVLGLGASAMSWREHVLLKTGAAIGPSLCHINDVFNCDAVNTSKYAELFGIPIAAIGFFFYSLSLVGAWYSGKQRNAKCVTGVFLIGGILSILVSAYLFYLSKVVLGVFCLFCMAMYLANFVITYGAFRAAKQFGYYDSVAAGFDAPWQFIRALSFGEPRGSRLSAVFVLCLGIIITVIALNGDVFVNASKSKSNATVKSTGEVPTNNSIYANWLLKTSSAITIPIVKEDHESSIKTDYTIGSPDAPITLIEFSDFECSACRQKYPLIEDLIKKYNGKIFFVVKNFPLDQECNALINRPMHDHACFAASFARCVGEQGRFWDGYSYIFTEPLLDQKTPRSQLTSKLYSWAKQNGLDLDGLATCVKSERPLKKIKEDIDLSIALQIEQTPTFYVNGRKTQFEELEAVIPGILATAPVAQ